MDSRYATIEELNGVGRRVDDLKNDHIECRSEKQSDQKNTEKRLDSQNLQQEKLFKLSADNRESIKNLESKDGRTQEHLENTDRGVEGLKKSIVDISETVEKVKEVVATKIEEQNKKINSLFVKQAFAAGGLAVILFLIELFFNISRG